jgi:hypothetical protein
MSFARWVEKMGLTAKAMPAPARPFCFAGGPGLNAVRSIERYTDGKNGSAALNKKSRLRFAQTINWPMYHYTDEVD